jgi:hypothetical protein
MPALGDVNVGGTEYKVYEDTYQRGSTPTLVPQHRSDSAQLPQLARGQSRGISISIHCILNHVAKNHLRVMAAIMFDNQLLIDDQGLPIAFNTTIHDPTSELVSKARENKLTPLTVSNPEFDGINNKSNRSTIITFHEEYRIFYDMLIFAVRTKKVYYILCILISPCG